MHHFILAFYSTCLFTGILYVLAWIRYQYRLSLWQVVEFFVLYYVLYVLFSYYFQSYYAQTDLIVTTDIFPSRITW